MLSIMREILFVGWHESHGHRRLVLGLVMCLTPQAPAFLCGREVSCGSVGIQHARGLVSQRKWDFAAHVYGRSSVDVAGTPAFSEKKKK